MQSDMPLFCCVNLRFVISKLLETHIPHRSVCSNNGGGSEFHALDVSSDS